MSSPSSPSVKAIKAAQELELEDDDVGFFDDIRLPATAKDPRQIFSTSPSALGDHDRSDTAHDDPSLPPNVMREDQALRPVVTASNSFRSISPAHADVTFHDQDMHMPSLVSDPDESDPRRLRLDSFADIALEETPETPFKSADPVSSGSKTSLFSARLGFGAQGPAREGMKEGSTASVSSSEAVVTTNWRTAVTNLLGGRPGGQASRTPSTINSRSPVLPTETSLESSDSSSSASFLLQRMTSPIASRDRRISREMGSADKLREGFERVRLEMEGAAREMRREEARTPEQFPADSLADIDWGFWGAVVQDYEEMARSKPKELSKAIQQGIPHVIRGAIWQLMSSSKSVPLEDTYKALLRLSSPHEKAIIKDINRTFPNHKYFKEGGGVGQESLYMVVKAYSLYDQEVGYTQGLAFIVAALLLNMPDEEAFCVLVRLMDSYNLRSHFMAGMPGLQLRLFQFDRLVEEILPLLHTHLTRKGVKSSMFASQWFMTLFSYRFPLSLVYRVLDIVFAEGIEAIFRFSLALLRKSEDDLLRLEFEQILAFLQTELFEVYRSHESDVLSDLETSEDERWKANEFVRDAYDIRITPFMLDSYESEYNDQLRERHKHAVELGQLRNANRSLSLQVKQLESSLATINEEHVELVRQLVMSKIEKEEIENELVRYKMLYAELAQAQHEPR